MQARYYDPVIGRFYSNDPIGFRDVHSFNRYAYANNNPYKYTDPDGEAAVLAVPAAVGVIILTGCNLSQGCSDSLRGVAKDLVSLLDFSSMFNESSDGGVFETDGVGKIKDKDLNPDDISDDDLDNAIDELDGSIGQREKENSRRPKGNPNGNSRDRENNKKHKGHKQRIEKEKKTREKLRERQENRKD
jgi:uncharacterized protein RhaS with RHS repeats